nr:hypothetical protein DOP62_12955 [Synechococcus elongatus PCC 11801]
MSHLLYALGADWVSKTIAFCNQAISFWHGISSIHSAVITMQQANTSEYHYKKRVTIYTADLNTPV